MSLTSDWKTVATKCTLFIVAVVVAYHWNPKSVQIWYQSHAQDQHTIGDNRRNTGINKRKINNKYKVNFKTKKAMKNLRKYLM